jgi:signal transduction histidine kinase
MSNQKKFLTTSSYEVWQKHFFRARITFACKLSMLFFSISGFFSWLFIYLDRSEDIWALRRDVLLLLLCGVGLLATKTLRGKHQLNLIFICLSLLLIFALNLETSTKGIALSDEFTGQVFLVLAVLIPVKLGLHIISQVSIISAYLIVEYFANPHSGNTFVSDAAVAVMELLDILQICVTCDLAIFLQEKLKKSELKTSYELQSFVKNISQKLREPLIANLQRLKQTLKHSGDSITIARSSLTTMLRHSDRQLGLIQLMLDRARINKLHQANRTQTDYQLWRLRFVKLRLLWFLGIYLCVFVALLLIGIYVIIFEAQSTEQLTPFLSYCFLSVFLIVCLAVCYRLSTTKLVESHFAWLFVTIIFILCLGFQAYDLLTGYFKLSVNSGVFLLAAILFPVFWRIHLFAQIGVAISYGAIITILTILSIDISMSTYEIFEEVWYFLIVCLICNLTVYSLEQLRKAESESRQQMQLFLYAIAHDLKTPILGMSMFLENLLSEPQRTFEFTRIKVNNLLQASDRQLYLLDSLLEVHQSESQGIICNCQPIELESLVTSISDGLEPILAKNEANLTNLIADNLPTINADVIQLGRVYENLIINAIKHNPPEINILLKAKLHKDLLYCTVEDNGVGIDSAICDRIFSLYARENVRRTPGLGLGLYLCRQIILAHQGEIGVNSSPGMGAVFWFTLPIAG